MKSLSLSLFVLLAVVHIGSGLKCYVGGKNSTTESHLKEKLILVPIKTCTKITTTVQGQSSVVRGGSPLDHSSGCSSTAVAQIETCYCNSDRCNTAATTAPISVAALLSTLILGPVLVDRLV
ncbi:unnamed protein product [Meganyctiphanes norvegica]|uniref:Protein sleepless n=1 Tax=Meganyctiphanes norvegica TaxID=48144 RepID=A0AAV2QD99_MEGNR